MKIAEAPGVPVGFAEAPVRNMLKEHIIDVPFRPVRNYAAEGAAALGRGPLKFKKIDMPIHRYLFPN
jgi:hypothetical protein